jgi:hypothetical protein
MRYWSNIREVTNGFDKAQLLAAVNVTDEWIEANQASFNNALPAAFRAGATLPQKTLLFCCVALARVSIAFLRRVMGEVD